VEARISSVGFGDARERGSVKATGCVAGDRFASRETTKVFLGTWKR
jgi:hypothetical protein